MNKQTNKRTDEQTNDMDDIYENIEEYDLNKESQILIIFDDDIIADMLNNKKTSRNSNTIIY